MEPMSLHEGSHSSGRDPNEVWLVTGCSSGFGKALSTALASRGSRLIATARNPASLGHLPDSDLILKLALDVTD